jgi:hypothetical protein
MPVENKCQKTWGKGNKEKTFIAIEKTSYKFFTYVHFHA